MIKFKYFENVEATYARVYRVASSRPVEYWSITYNKWHKSTEHYRTCQYADGYVPITKTKARAIVRSQGGVFS